MKRQMIKNHSGRTEVMKSRRPLKRPGVSRKWRLVGRSSSGDPDCARLPAREKVDRPEIATARGDEHAELLSQPLNGGAFRAHYSD